MGKFINEFSRLLGMAILALAIVGGVVFVVYLVIGEFTDEGRHWYATGLTFAVPLAYVIGLQYAKSHRAGLERGIDLKLGARERAQQRPIATMPATPSTAHTPAVTAATQAARWNEDLLPTRSGQAVIITRRDDNANPIEM